MSQLVDEIIARSAELAEHVEDQRSDRRALSGRDPARGAGPLLRVFERERRFPDTSHAGDHSDVRAIEQLVEPRQLARASDHARHRAREPARLLGVRHV